MIHKDIGNLFRDEYKKENWFYFYYFYILKTINFNDNNYYEALQRIIQYKLTILIPPPSLLIKPFNIFTNTK